MNQISVSIDDPWMWALEEKVQMHQIPGRIYDKGRL